MNRKPLVLMILDGWGHRDLTENNAISIGNTPCWDHLWASKPKTLIETSGEAVGLPDGQMGNSEVGHMNIGAGRTVFQDYSRIENAIKDGSFQQNTSINEAIEATDGTVHIMGLLSPGGVHSHDRHFRETVRLAAERGARSIAVHAFLDGRDTPPRSAGASIKAMQDLVDSIPAAHFSSLCGRYYAMDRDMRWDRVEKAWKMLTTGSAEVTSATAIEGLQLAYDRDENDEFVQPTAIEGGRGIEDGDSIIFINFRADRARELTMAFVLDEFDGFERQKPDLAAFVCMAEYQAGLPVTLAFPPITLQRLFAQEIANAGLKQLRIAETEKYAHVTFFFNGGIEEPFENEERILIPSPGVATYDLQPEMSAPELTERLVAEIESGRFDVIICNVANPDMVGHTGKLDAAVLAVEAVDRCLKAVSETLEKVGGELLVTADHGNVEMMVDPSSGQSHTAHTTNPVPLIFQGRPARLIDGGSLRDIAPTMLALLGLPQPGEMTGTSLLSLESESASVDDVSLDAAGGALH